MKQVKISKLSAADKIVIFRHLAETKAGVDADILESISTQSYDEFIEFCDTVFENKDTIKSIHCSRDDNGRLEFGFV